MALTEAFFRPVAAQRVKQRDSVIDSGAQDLWKSGKKSPHLIAPSAEAVVWEPRAARFDFTDTL